MLLVPYAATAQEPAQREPPPTATSSRAASGEVSLAALLAYAERHGPAVAVATKRRAYGPAAREGAEPLFRQNPTLELGIGPRFDGLGTRNYDVFAAFGQPVEIAGERGLRLEAARRLGDRVDAEAGSTRWSIRQQVILAYRTATVSRERVALADRLVAFANDMLIIARRRFTAGDVSAIDVRVAEVDLAQARQAKILAEQELRSAQLVLCEVTGWPIENPPLPHAGLAAPRDVPPLDSVLRRASARHPELRARHAAVEEAHARVELADREAWPTPTVGASFAREGQTTEPANYIVLWTIGLPLPFWQLNQGERARARVDEGVARTEEDATTRVLRVRIARAHSDLRAAHERVSLYTSGVTPSIEDMLSLLRRGFDAGEIPIFNVLVARERILRAQGDALNAHADYYRALVDLESAVGTELSTGGDPR